jgi:hypothetical protein
LRDTSKPQSLTVFALFVSAFVFVLLPSADAARKLNNAQLKFVFTNAEMELTGGTCSARFNTEPSQDVADINLKFLEDDRAEIDIFCRSAHGPWRANEVGEWFIENGRLCLESKGPYFQTMRHTFNPCWAVGKGRFGLEAFDSAGDTIWRFRVTKHPKTSSREELLTALKEIRDTSGPTTAQITEQKKAIAELARIRKEQELALEELRQQRETLENSITAASGTNQDTSGPTAAQIAEQKKAIAELTRIRKEQELALEELRRQREALETSPLVAAIPVQDTESEADVWQNVKHSDDIQVLSHFLDRFPEGRYSADASARIAVLERFKLVEGVDFGTYHALVIGIDKYENLENLNMAVRDASAIANILHNDYGFKVSLLKNPGRSDILDVFDELRETLTEKDNLLIYYAGHGWQDEGTDQGYWLTTNAKPNRRSNWLSNGALIDTMKGLQAKHIMVVADSCFSGTLVRSGAVGFETADYKSGEYWRRMASKQARVALVSGGLEPVADDGGGGHSPFAKAFIDALTENKVVIDGTALFNKLRRPVIVAAQQTPQYSDVRNTGHEGGDFLFVRKH